MLVISTPWVDILHTPSSTPDTLDGGFSLARVRDPLASEGHALCREMGFQLNLIIGGTGEGFWEHTPRTHEDTLTWVACVKARCPDAKVYSLGEPTQEVLALFHRPPRPPLDTHTLCVPVADHPHVSSVVLTRIEDPRPWGQARLEVKGQTHEGESVVLFLSTHDMAHWAMRERLSQALGTKDITSIKAPHEDPCAHGVIRFRTPEGYADTSHPASESFFVSTHALPPDAFDAAVRLMDHCTPYGARETALLQYWEGLYLQKNTAPNVFNVMDPEGAFPDGKAPHHPDLLKTLWQRFFDHPTVYGNLLLQAPVAQAPFFKAVADTVPLPRRREVFKAVLPRLEAVSETPDTAQDRFFLTPTFWSYLTTTEFKALFKARLTHPEHPEPVSVWSQVLTEKKYAFLDVLREKRYSRLDEQVLNVFEAELGDTLIQEGTPGLNALNEGHGSERLNTVLKGLGVLLSLVQMDALVARNAQRGRPLSPLLWSMCDRLRTEVPIAQWVPPKPLRDPHDRAYTQVLIWARCLTHPHTQARLFEPIEIAAQDRVTSPRTSRLFEFPNDVEQERWNRWTQDIPLLRGLAVPFPKEEVSEAYKGMIAVFQSIFLVTGERTPSLCDPLLRHAQETLITAFPHMAVPALHLDAPQVLNRALMTVGADDRVRWVLSPPPGLASHLTTFKVIKNPGETVETQGLFEALSLMESQGEALHPVFQAYQERSILASLLDTSLSATQAASHPAVPAP
jgi:hypothetical protein